MRCPFCGHKKTKVVDKRDRKGVSRRRRECKKCERRFTTYERPDIEVMVVKKDGTREKYNRDKLKSGIVEACEKRPVSAEKIEETVDRIEEDLRKKRKEVKSSEIGKEVMEELKKIDEVAYIRFASVYKEFKDSKDFRNVIEDVSEDKKINRVNKKDG